jgi:hypothetical protein
MTQTRIGARLLARLQKLEAQQPRDQPAMFRYGWLKPLQHDYVGERHVVIVKREPTRSPGFEWCEFEERLGPAPAGLNDGAFEVYFPQ